MDATDGTESLIDKSPEIPVSAEVPVEKNKPLGPSSLSSGPSSPLSRRCYRAGCYLTDLEAFGGLSCGSHLALMFTAYLLAWFLGTRDGTSDRALGVCDIVMRVAAVAFGYHLHHFCCCCKSDPKTLFSVTGSVSHA